LCFCFHKLFFVLTILTFSPSAILACGILEIFAGWRAPSFVVFPSRTLFFLRSCSRFTKTSPSFSFFLRASFWHRNSPFDVLDFFPRCSFNKNLWLRVFFPRSVFFLGLGVFELALPSAFAHIPVDLGLLVSCSRESSPRIASGPRVVEAPSEILFPQNFFNNSFLNFLLTLW